MYYCSHLCVCSMPLCHVIHPHVAGEDGPRWFKWSNQVLSSSEFARPPKTPRCANPDLIRAPLSLSDSSKSNSSSSDMA